MYLKLIVTGFLEDEPAGKVSISLAHNAKPIEGWKEIRLDQLGMVDRIVFSFESNDFDQYGLRVPKYFCIDDIKIK